MSEIGCVTCISSTCDGAMNWRNVCRDYIILGVVK